MHLVLVLTQFYNFSKAETFGVSSSKITVITRHRFGRSKKKKIQHSECRSVQEGGG